jgi:Flp pilus assembly protein protease CpaA
MLDIFLVVFGLIYIVAASIQDLRKREVWNWLNFSLIIFAIAYRAFYAIINFDVMFFVYGLIGLGIFIGLGYLFYYARVFAGGDAKLLMGVGGLIALNNSIYSNLIGFGAFIMFLLFFGSVYGIVYSISLAFMHRGKFFLEFRRVGRKNRRFFFICLGLGILFLCVPILLHEAMLLIFSVIILLLPLMYTFGKAVENSCMIAELETRKLTEGDWLYERVKFRGRVFKPYWEGLSLDEIKFLRKYKKKVKIKQGIPFVPAFLFAYVAWILVFYNGVDLSWI